MKDPKTGKLKRVPPGPPGSFPVFHPYIRGENWETAEGGEASPRAPPSLGSPNSWLAATSASSLHGFRQPSMLFPPAENLRLALRIALMLLAEPSMNWDEESARET